MVKKKDLRSLCPIAGALDLLGDKWTLLVLRDVLFFNKQTFKEFQESPEKMSSNTLSNRLQRLEDAGVLEKEIYQDKPIRYRYFATKKGKDLKPLLMESVKWAQAHVPGVFKGKIPTKH